LAISSLIAYRQDLALFKPEEAESKRDKESKGGNSDTFEPPSR
jgi:hypothetical protein